MPEAHSSSSIPTKILLPIDFSPSSQAALETASDLAKHFHAELYLVNVIPMFPATTIPDMVPENKFVEEARTFAEQHLAKCHAALASRGVKSTSSVEVGNDVVSGWQPLVFGSIAAKVIKLVECPLLLLRSAKSENGVKAAATRSTEWW